MQAQACLYILGGRLPVAEVNYSTAHAVSACQLYRWDLVHRPGL
jgi:hypothetical protein